MPPSPGLGRASEESRIVFAISPVVEVAWIARRPRRAGQLELEGWRFLPLRRRWDAVDRQLLSMATGLSAYSETVGEEASQAWWIAYLHAWVSHKDPILALKDVQGSGAI